MAATAFQVAAAVCFGLVLGLTLTNHREGTAAVVRETFLLLWALCLWIAWTAK